jgi:transcription initiation factor TFIIB
MASQRDRIEYNRNLEREHTLLNTVRPGELESLTAPQIEPYAAAFDVSKGTYTTAESLLLQHLLSLDGAHVIEVYVGAAFYCAAKIQELGYTPDEVADTGPNLVTKKVLLRSSKRIAQELGLDTSLFTDTSQYVDRFCSILETSKEVRQRVYEIVNRCEEAGLSSGKSPMGWAATAIYLSGLEAGARLRQHDIAEVTEVTEVTIRNRYQEQQAFPQRDDTPGDTPRAQWVGRCPDDPRP